MITPVGLDTETSWKVWSVASRASALSLNSMTKAIPTQIAGEIHGFEPEKFIDLKEIKKMDRFIHLAIAASQMAMDSAGLKITEENAERVGVWSAREWEDSLPLRSITKYTSSGDIER